MEAIELEPAEPEKIEAGCVTLEVIDQETGKTYRRLLPLYYLENTNGILLSGENASGVPVEIAFLSEAAIEKMKDLLGKGPDQPRCDHSHE